MVNFNQSASKLLLEVYQLKYFPVGIKFVKKGENLFNFQRTKERKPVCAFIKIAAQGKSFYLDKNAISCPGGAKWLGFPSKLTETFLYELFLGKIEKIKGSPEIAEKFINALPKPPEEGLYEKILFAPLQNCQYEPDLVLIITNPREVYRIIVSTYLDDYHLVKNFPLCSLCQGVITIPFITDELNVSMIDPIAREIGGYNDNEIIIGIPKKRFISLINNLKKTPYGSKKESLFSKIIQKLFVE